MVRNHKRTGKSRSRGMSRRTFVKLAAASLLAGCTPVQEPTATPVLSQRDVSRSKVEGPTATPSAAPTATPTPAPTATQTPPPSVEVRRPDVIVMYPDVSSAVVHARHEGVWEGETVVPGAVRQMLDASITELTGLNDAREAWASLFAPDERVAIKVNTIRSSRFWTHIPLVIAVTESLQEAGVPAEQIYIFDRATGELERVGYPVNRDSPGVRCFGTGVESSGGWTLLDGDIGLSNILLSCHALINIPILKQHGMGGISFALKNHYGTFDRPRSYHGTMDRAIPALNALPPIADRTRLIVGDMLSVVDRGWRTAVTGDSILMSFDPVAHDAVGLAWYERVMAGAGVDTAMAHTIASDWLRKSAELGLGTDDAAHIDLKEISLS